MREELVLVFGSDRECSGECCESLRDLLGSSMVSFVEDGCPRSASHRGNFASKKLVLPFAAATTAFCMSLNFVAVPLDDSTLEADTIGNGFSLAAELSSTG